MPYNKGLSFSFSGLDTYGFSACMEQVKKVISQAQVHKPSKTFKKHRLLSEVICEAFRCIMIMVFLFVTCKTGQALPCLTTCTVLQACCLGEWGGEDLCITWHHGHVLNHFWWLGSVVEYFYILLGKTHFQPVWLINFFSWPQTRLKWLKSSLSSLCKNYSQELPCCDQKWLKNVFYWGTSTIWTQTGYGWNGWSTKRDLRGINI